MLILTTFQKRRYIKEEITITTDKETIKKSETEKLLGIELEENLGFGTHIDNLIEKLKTGVKALKSVAKIANFATRKNLMNCLITSRMTYGIALWGGIPAYRYEALQTIQNEAARIVTKRKWEIKGTKLMKTEEILKQAGQLSVRQLATYHTLMQIKKILTNRQPEYLYRRLSENVRTHTYSLRNRTPGDIIRSRTNLSITKNSFIERGTEAWNKLPTQLREEPLKAFKKHLRSWVRTNVPISIKKGNG